jgi:hypothetical protein
MQHLVGAYFTKIAKINFGIIRFTVIASARAANDNQTPVGIYIKENGMN